MNDLEELSRNIDHTLSHLECFDVGNHQGRITDARRSLQEKPITKELIVMMDILLRNMQGVFKGEGTLILIRMTRDKIEKAMV